MTVKTNDPFAGKQVAESNALFGGTAVATAQGGPTGNEYLGADAFSSSRIVLLQQMSPQVAEADRENYVPGATPGQFLERASGRLLGSEFLAINVFFRTRYVVWADRNSGEGLLGSFKDRAAAETFAMTKPGSRSEFTHEHYLMVPGSPTELAGPFTFGMSRSKLQPSRAWNAALAQAAQARYAKVWKVSSIPVQSKQGNTVYNYHNVAVALPDPSGSWALEAHLKAAESACQMLVEAEKAAPEQFVVGEQESAAVPQGEDPPY